MFNDETEKSLLTLLRGLDSRPLSEWDKKVRSGHVKQIIDNDMQCPVIEILSKKCQRTFITCPGDPNKILGARSPIITFSVKNLHKPLAIEIQIRDDKNVKRRFRAATFQESTDVTPFLCKMPLTLEDGWNDVAFHLKEYIEKAYGSVYLEILRIQLYANCRFHRVYFSDKVNREDELPLDINSLKIKSPLIVEG